MARKKKSSKQKAKKTQLNTNKNKITEKIEKIDYQKILKNTLQSNYQYFMIGLLVVILISIGSFAFIKKTNLAKKLNLNGLLGNNVIKKENDNRNKGERVYVVKERDNLWKISESMYGSGYNQEDIIQANGLISPNSIVVGQKLIIPSVKPKTATSGEISPGPAFTIKVEDGKSTSYVVQEGDYLWQIAEKMYGDGNMWQKIAEANNLTDPNDVHKNNVLKIPR